jgi:outer membrane protein assembly factor BamD (BamD/ComL family)
MGELPFWAVALIVLAVLLCLGWLIDLAEKSKKKKQTEQAYLAALAMMERKDFERASAAFEKLGDYKDSAALREKCGEGCRRQQYDRAVRLMEAGQYGAAYAILTACRLPGGQAEEKIRICEEHFREEKYQQAVRLMEAGETGKALDAFNALRGYRDSAERARACARTSLEKKQREEERERQAAEQRNAQIYEKGAACFRKGDLSAAAGYLDGLPDGYRERDDMMREIRRQQYGDEFCPDSPQWRHDWEVVRHVKTIDNELRKAGHGTKRCKCCGRVEEYEYDYDADGY